MDPLLERMGKIEQTRKVSKTVERIIYNLIFNYVKHMVYVMKVEKGPKFRYLFVNEMGLLYAGLSENAIGKTMDEVLPHDRYIEILKGYEDVLSTGEIITYSDHLKFPNGKMGFAESILTPVKNEKNEIKYIVAVTRDVTDLTVERNRLINAEQKYRSIVDHNLDGVFTVSLEGKILEVNPAGQKLSGYTKKQVSKRSFYDLLPEEDVQKFRELFNKTTTSGLAQESLDCRVMHSKGYFLTTQIKIVPIVINSEITGAYVMTRDISEQAENAETIKYMAFHDHLTGLYNRRALLNDLEEAIKKNKKTSGTFALLSIDLDRFKYLNDTLGHLAGDQILIQVAERLSEYSNRNVKVYRLGGDEYSILYVGDRRGATYLAQKILNLFSKSFYLNYQEYFISPSIGISMYPNDGKNAEMLIKNADEALFSVKERGKAHFQFYRTEMNSAVSHIVELETHLRKALAKKEFILYYQPQVDLASGQVNSFEALLRWNSKELGMISPNDFIPLAEDTGLIVPIGNWVIDTACKQISEWSSLGESGIKIAINISPKQFLQPKLVETIKESIEKYEIEPSLLEIEITEGAMQDTAETSPILKSLKELGVTISIDDFGTGYSSLNYIKQFPIDVLKIDQSFVRDVISNEKDAAITTTIIHLANSLGLEVVAEGIEEKEQADFLMKANCHKGQGYLYSRPISAQDVEFNLFKSNNAIVIN
ncbi:EAL domain-containing protein [Robertmurraya yapensis]|uniref:EAL domain-containing protein n=2 Tax=Bacillaceae TaxID=186817 RepID=A0A431WAC8_9BACI|nr:EAL domain-containing protein [Bacillus yapensis]RTR32367.1 EAL domain-containing protein [Bacillus yapensis]TKS96561.1 EAL domain-containing protein [Bacillus yapensis]